MSSEDASSTSVSPTDGGDVQSHQFTAVNNANSTSSTVNGASLIASSNKNLAAQSGVSLFGGPVPGRLSAADSSNPAAGGSGNEFSNSLLPQPAEEGWNQRAASETPSVKRKRSIDGGDQPGRAVSPTTATQRHHLAAHEAALGLGGDREGDPMQLSEDRYDMERGQSGMEDDGPLRAGPQGSPQPEPGCGGDPKRRKRQFSNRTKTGCITCRRRKKKCDEGKPECSNCKRGGFVCEGYSGKVSWQKPPGKAGHIVNQAATPTLIQSRPDQLELSSATPTPAQSVHASRLMLPHQATLEQRGYPRPDEKQGSEDPTSPGSVRPQGYESTLSATPYASSSVPSVTPGIPASAASAQLSFPHTLGPGGALSRQKSEKEKMIASELYHANDPGLVAERDACKAACQRYNEASNPNKQISDAEKGRLLHDILRPGKLWEAITTGIPSSTVGLQYISDSGYASDLVDVTVEAPFTCSYGYNIKLGKGVLIEFGCTILDSCLVQIKARSILSPNVSIYSATHPIDPRKRNGSKGPEMAKPVVIEEDCWLGGNVIVLGGITIGKGSVVGAGSVVTRDVPPFTVVAGNPARVIRGIYSQNGGDM